MNELHFYVNKTKAILLLLISCAFTFCGLFLRNRLYEFEEKPFKTIVLILGFLLFLFGIVLNIILLTRKKPLLTITETNIILYNLFKKPVEIKLDEVESFKIITTYIKGVSNSVIYIKLKSSNNPFQYSIPTIFLNIRKDKLLNILNQKLKKAT